MRFAAIAAFLFALLPASRLAGQSDRSLTDSDYDSLLGRPPAGGPTIIVPGAPARNPDPDQAISGENDDTRAMREKILLLRTTIQSLTDSLAIANSEAEMFKRQSADLSSKVEGMGLAGLEKDESKLQQRLLAAVRDLRILKQQKDDATNQLVRLSEAIQVLIKGTDAIDPQVRMNVETELRKTNEILGVPTAARVEGTEATLSDGMIVDVKEDLSLIVANIGEKQGVKIGMPFQVWRNNKHIGDVRVVDVRERISGAIIQSLESEKSPIKTGDRLRVDTKQN